jgi:diphosphoinositol-polyphosphate diphosphatase
MTGVELPFINSMLASPSTRPLSKDGRVAEERQELPMSTEALSKLCFPLNLDLSIALASEQQHRETESLHELRRISVQANKEVVKNLTSRHGTYAQRYSTESGQSVGDEERSVVARLTTGTVPILSDGRVLLVSTSKSDWVFPKGGWEQDETLPLGSIRETFEEAGVVGILGPPLPSVCFETRKAIKRRLELSRSTSCESESDAESLTRHRSFYGDTERTFSSKSSNGIANTGGQKPMDGRLVTQKGLPSPSGSPTATPQNHTHNRMTIFPLYVQHVYENWPESRRLRLAVSIEQAEALLSHRTEFLSVIKAVKESKLHQVALPHEITKG